MSDVQRLLWRAAAGLLHRDLVTARLREEIAGLVTEYRADEPSWSHLIQPGTRPYDSAAGFDDAIAGARIAVTAGDFPACSTGLQDARAAWRDLQLVAAAHGAIGEAETTLGDVRAVLGSRLHEQLEVTDACARLLRRAVALCGDGEVRQARFIATTSRRHAEALLQHGGRATPVAALAARAAAVRRLAARPEVRDVDDTELTEALQSLERLMQQELFVLAEHVLDHVERATAAARTYLGHVDGGPPGDAASPTKPATISTSRWWRDATERRLQAELDALGDAIDALTATARTYERAAHNIDHETGGTE